MIKACPLCLESIDCWPTSAAALAALAAARVTPVAVFVGLSIPRLSAHRPMVRALG